MEVLNDSGEYEFSHSQDAAWKRAEEPRQAARKVLVLKLTAKNGGTEP
jgi:hypothetical protein